MNPSRVVIVDSGICNLFNVRRAFERLGAEVVISRSSKDINEATRVVLPGVGAFGAAMTGLEQEKLIDPIRQYANSGKPLMGICLGMQLLMSHSEEYGSWEGLNLIEGNVRILKSPEEGGAKFKIPEIGWNVLEENPELYPAGKTWEGTALQGLGQNPYMYFVHSFVVVPESPKDILAYTRYGRDHYCSVVHRDNVTGCQFHPERSGEAGLKILENFLK